MKLSILQQQSVTTMAVPPTDYICHDGTAESRSCCLTMCRYTRIETADRARGFIVRRSHGIINFPPPPHPRKSLACCISRNFMTAALPHGEQWRRHPILCHRQSGIEYVTS
ncbi:uncharacterized protein TrAFT101_005084 [Trichoderma asperellum]|uniref:uncharacterized protein n=1 Tax=Trichoderma asperellum TaxID=101201 RepID=UPI00332CE0A1|nr:hypothetical protein TrAFT101_005084 [Trichoderma asperellum]